MKKHIAILLAMVMLLTGCVVHSDQDAMGSAESTTEPSTQQFTENCSEATEVTTVTEESTESATDSTVSSTEATEAEKDNQTSTKPSTEPTQGGTQTKPQETTPPSTKPTESTKPTQPATKPTEPEKETTAPTEATAPPATEAPTKPTEPPVTATLTLGASTKTLNVGDTYQIPYTYTGTKTLTFWSEDEAVASVSSKGVVTAKKKGNILIEVSDGTLAEYIEITVRDDSYVYATSIDVKATDGPFYDGLTDYAGDYVWVVFRTNYEATNRKITASSSNSSVVSVSKSNSTGGYNNAYAFEFKFKSAGTATITVQSDDGAVTLKYQITVKSGYSCAHGGGTHSPEEWASCATTVAHANGVKNASYLGSWRLFTLSANQLTFDRAIKAGQGIVHDYWGNGIRYVYFEYVGQDDNGNYQFHECWG